MILLTVGTEKFSFHRLLDAFDALCAGPLKEVECFAQIGSCRAEPQHLPFERMLPFPRMLELTESADLVVTHAGAGSMLLAVRSGKRPVVVPRLAAEGEHVDDHQLQLARKLAAEGLVRCVEDVALLGAEIEEAIAHPDPPGSGHGSEALVAGLDALIARVEAGGGLQA